ncbi:flap endonuclease Xni [Gallaecimonas sp. GXIMD1310]|uniref:flap endonuclease Xni n=1 Tax=Gallaecimonas sp. GXIMD1310 TaxID=3131926 RepID=UPI00324D21E1
MRLLLIDALNLIRRLHAANAEQVVAASVNAWQRLQSALKPTHALAVFDGQAPSWRYQRYPDYKAGRKPMPADLPPRFSALAGQWQTAGLRSWFPEAEEADDLIASLAVAARSHNIAVAIASTDKGYAQLLDAGVVQYDPFNRQFLDGQHWQQKLAIRPSQLVDFLALTGDSTNSIAGVPGVGAKTAAALLQRFGHLQAILATDDVDSSVSKVQQHQQAARLARQLVKLQTDLPLPFSLSDLRIKEQP